MYTFYEFKCTVGSRQIPHKFRLWSVLNLQYFQALVMFFMCLFSVSALVPYRPFIVECFFDVIGPLSVMGSSPRFLIAPAILSCYDLMELDSRLPDATHLASLYSK